MIKNLAEKEFFKKVSGAEERRPLFGQWELTYRCNLKCVMCYTDCFNTPQDIRRELSTPEIYQIMDGIREAGGLGLTLTGGEPLSHPDFPEIYKRAVRLGFLVSVYTNATLIQEDTVRLWQTCRPDMIEISMHGLGERFDEVTAMRGSFNRCVEAVKALLRAHLPVTLKTVGLSLNQDQVLEIRRFAESLGVARWYFGEDIREALDGSRAPFRFQLSHDELMEFEKEDPRMLEEHWQKKHKDAERYRKERSGNPFENRCGSRTKFNIDPYGGLQLCSKNRMKSYDLTQGSFREGFFKALAGFPCPKKPAMSASFQEIE